MTGTEKNTSSLIACIKPVDSLYDQGSRSACASASVEGESLFAAHGRNRRGRECSILFRNLGFPGRGEHDPHAPSGGGACVAAVAVFTKTSDLARREEGRHGTRHSPGAILNNRCPKYQNPPSRCCNPAATLSYIPPRHNTI
jgi:hypothetical protein